MFAELGYKKESKYYYHTEKEIRGTLKHIRFLRQTREFVVESNLRFSEEITMQELTAINKKVQELRLERINIMEDEIKVGEYVRTKLGDIKQITEGFEFIIERLNKSDNYITKHSEDIKDLLEIKDVIHYRIDNISTTLETKGYIESIVDIQDGEMLKSIKENPDYHILEILTKEQWNQTAYTIHEREEKENG